MQPQWLAVMFDDIKRTAMSDIGQEKCCYPKASIFVLNSYKETLKLGKDLEYLLHMYHS